jgi:hypothetical protein
MGQVDAGESGLISVEDEGASFIIHANYGYRTGQRPLGELRPGDAFIARPPESTDDKRTYKLSALYEDGAEGRCEQTSAIHRFGLHTIVEIPDTEEIDPDHPLGEVWREGVHPEFEWEDMDDLLAALQQAKARHERLY